MSILGEKGKKINEFINEFHSRPKIDLQYYFHATGPLLKDFAFFDNFDHIFTSLLSLARPLKVGMMPLGQKFDL